MHTHVNTHILSHVHINQKHGKKNSQNSCLLDQNQTGLNDMKFQNWQTQDPGIMVDVFWPENTNTGHPKRQMSPAAGSV